MVKECVEGAIKYHRGECADRIRSFEVNWIRDFSAQEGHYPRVRNVEDAPQPMRRELLDLFFGLAEQNPATISDTRVYNVIYQSLGMGFAANPYGGYRYAVGRDIGGPPWPRIYDLISRLYREYEGSGLGEQFRTGVNRILAAHGSAWDSGEDGGLHRVLPAAAQAQVAAAIAELRHPQYAPALVLFDAARDAYDDRPRRDRDACGNVFDAMESVIKTAYNLPQATFGQVLAHIEQLRRNQEQAQPPQHNAFRPDTIEILRRINDLRNHHFGHGMVGAFELSPAEVDFAYLACIGGILLFTRTP